MSRRFCSLPGTSTRFADCRSLTDLRAQVMTHGDCLTCEEAAFVLKQCIALKKVNDPKSRGLIPKEVLETVADSIIRNVDSLSPESVVDTVAAVGDSSRTMDEYIMFKLARTVSARVGEFTLTQLLEIARVYSKRDIRDEEMFDHIISSILSQNSSLSFSQLVDFNRSLSRIAMKNTQLCDLIASQYTVQRRLSVRDVISCLIAFADLDFNHMVVDRMWAYISSRDNVCKYTSNDDQYGLLFAAIRYPSVASYTIVESILKNASGKNRIRKRIDLLGRCISVGMLDSKFEQLLPGSPTSSKKSESTAVSSGLHMEVCHTLRGMRTRYTNELDLGPFIVDILVRKRYDVLVCESTVRKITQWL